MNFLHKALNPNPPRCLEAPKRCLGSWDGLKGLKRFRFGVEGLGGLGLPVIEKHVDKTMEDEIETGFISGVSCTCTFHLERVGLGYTIL